jgi:hypothetical protein
MPSGGKQGAQKKNSPIGAKKDETPLAGPETSQRRAR